MSSPVTDALGRFVSRREPFDPRVRDLAGRHILDTLASIVACRDLEPSRMARRYVRRHGSQGRTTILGTAHTAGLVDAVFAGAMTAHAAEVNDFMPSVFVQPGPAVVSAAIGTAGDVGASGADLVHAVVVGYELAARIPRAVGVANLRAAGLATHGVAPCFAAAAATASLLRLPADRIGDVLSCSAQQASGSWQWLRDVEHMEKAFVFGGMGARNGVQAALLVDAGFRGVPSALDDPAGWLSSPAFVGGDADPTALVTGLDEPSALTDVAYKRYPVGGPAQPAVAALLDLVGVVDPAEVSAVCIAMPGRADAFRDAGMPALNLRYLTAIILIDGRLDFTAAQCLDRLRHDERVASRMRDVEVVHDPAQETGTGRSRAESARVTMTLRDGSVHDRFIGHVRGFPSHPMDREDVESKALDLVAPHLGQDRADALLRACRDLESLDHAADLARLIAR